MLTRNQLAANLRDVMSRLKISTRALLKVTNLSQKSISNVLNAEHALTIDKLEDLAGAFGLKGWQLLAGDDHLTRAQTPSAQAGHLARLQYHLNNVRIEHQIILNDQPATPAFYYRAPEPPVPRLDV